MANKLSDDPALPQSEPRRSHATPGDESEHASHHRSSSSTPVPGGLRHDDSEGEAEHRSHAPARVSAHSEAGEVVAEHRSHAPARVSVFVVTCSDSRDARTDRGGQALQDGLEQAGHVVAGRRWVKDDALEIRQALDDAERADAAAAVFTGGTGIGRRDSTLEVLAPLFEKTLPGFGELFRMLSFEEIGSAAMLSRAAAGTIRGLLVFALPGSPAAVRLALERLILPELGHAVRELTR